ncbi:MFS transporter [Bacillus sp. HMF5848]|uniref:MFS transporter n=1 Tax=Bacillus sp. HMF5848 TaxID=2495421 RepID=UPI000F79DF2C|nr:MFS transporter [Bacillus sp. HMF5848]RSK29049.1 MFS transporter [Bacillus sp. HMF5848]
MPYTGQVNSLRIFLFFFHASVTIIISFLPVYFKSEGLSGAQIGWLLAIGPMISMITQPIAGFLSDKYKTVKKLLLISLLGTIVFGTIMFQMHTFALFLLVGLFFFAFMSPLGALGDSLTQTTATISNKKFGSIRSFGSLGFATASLIGGVILGFIGIANVGYVFIGLLSIAFLLCLKVTDVSLSKNPVTVIDTFKLFKNRRLVVFLGIMLFITITHRTNDSYLGIYIESLGGNEQLIGLAWFIAVLSEAIIFATSRHWIDRFNLTTLIVVASLVYTVRWFLFSIANDPSFIIMFQFMHGLSFGIFFSCAFEYVSRLVPRDYIATGHLLFIMFFFGFSGIIGSLAGGMILDVYGGSTLYVVLGIMTLIGSLALYAFSYKTEQKKENVLAH